MLHWSYYVLLLCVLVCGLLLNVLTLPGNWVMLIAMFGYAWATHWWYVGPWWLLLLFAIAALAEVLELAIAGSGAKKAGGGIWGTIGALIGAVLGGVFLSFVPIPVVSTLIGILLGTFLGAMAAEALAGKDIGRSVLIGYGAAKGRLYGTLMKIALGCVILILGMVAALPWTQPPKAKAAVTPTSLPAAPTTQAGAQTAPAR